LRGDGGARPGTCRGARLVGRGLGGLRRRGRLRGRPQDRWLCRPFGGERYQKTIGGRWWLGRWCFGVASGEVCG